MVYFEQALEQGPQKNFLVTNRPGSQDSQVYWLDSSVYFAPAVFLSTDFGQLPHGENTWELITNTNNSSNIRKNANPSSSRHV